jgi:hypothetical protein
MATAPGTVVYSPLNASQIRLLVLLPAVSDDLIRCKLVEMTQQPGTLPGSLIYDALSYVWGPPHPTGVIYVNDCPFAVRQNLERALTVLRHSQFPRCLWVDAICINQADTDERGSQVANMSGIFRMARKVLVWLGMELNKVTSSSIFSLKLKDALTCWKI